MENDIARFIEYFLMLFDWLDANKSWILFIGVVMLIGIVLLITLTTFARKKQSTDDE